MINSYDIDGVINMGEYVGLKPGSPYDIIITGRSIDEQEYTKAWLHSRGIANKVFFNNIPFNEKTREKSGEHKAEIINMFMDRGVQIGIHFEDDPIQADIIERLTPVRVVRIVHDLVEKENVWHGPTNDKRNIRTNTPTALG